MNTNTIHDRLLDKIRQKLPSNNLVNNLTDILCIRREAVYRRLRKEVSFTLEEVASIASALKISIDDIIGMDMPNNHPFQLKLIGYATPSTSNNSHKCGFLEFIENVSQMPNTEKGGYGNAFDSSFIFQYENITRFILFKWYYQRSGKKNTKAYEDIILSEEQKNVHAQYVQLSKEIKRTYYVWDYMIFQYLINNICYFRDLQLIPQQNLSVLKQELFLFVDYLEKIAINGCFENGNSVRFYISNMNFQSTYNYIESDDIHFTYIKTLTTNALVSSNHNTTDNIKKWIISQKQLGILISESAEMQRISFFKRQREIIDTI